MTAYLQMGHDSENLLPHAEPALSGFAGAILSPVNAKKSQVIAQISKSPADFDLVFDPQLYFPRAERGHLKEWDYFPSDVDTADAGSTAWWEQLVEDIVTSCIPMKPTAVCSPASVPNVFTDAHFELSVVVGDMLAESLKGSGIRPIQSAIVGLSELTVPNRPLEIASILSGAQAEEVYLVLVGDTEPRRELSKANEIKGAMKLVAALKQAGSCVLVPFCSSDLHAIRKVNGGGRLWG